MGSVARALLDTNACLYLLKGQVDPSFELQGGFISIISKVELLGYPDITPAEEQLIETHLSTLTVVPVDEPIAAEAIRLRRTRSLKLGDALIVATALSKQIALISHDKALANVPGLQILTLPLVP